VSSRACVAIITESGVQCAVLHHDTHPDEMGAYIFDCLATLKTDEDWLNLLEYVKRDRYFFSLDLKGGYDPAPDADGPQVWYPQETSVGRYAWTYLILPNAKELAIYQGDQPAPYASFRVFSGGWPGIDSGRRACET
jgi:hypothetical protein